MALLLDLHFSLQSLVSTLALLALGCLVSEIASASIIATSGTVVLDANPYPSASDTQIFAFDEQQSVAFVATQGLDFGSIAPGTIVNSHYIQYDTVSATGTVGAGTVTFDGIILGVVTATANLTSDLSPDVPAASDVYFGLETTLGAYPAGAAGTEQFRGLGSPLDDLIIDLGTDTLTISGLQIETAGALDGIRVFTAVPEPSTGLLFALAMMGLAATRRAARRE